MRFDHTACLTFIVLLFGTVTAAPVPPHPGAHLALNYDEAYRDLGRASGVDSVPLDLEARADSSSVSKARQNRLNRATASRTTAAEDWRDVATNWRAGSHPGKDKKAADADAIAAHHENFLADPSLHTNGGSGASTSEAVATKSRGDAAKDLAEARKHLRVTSPSPTGRVVEQRVVKAYKHGAKVNRRIATHLRLTSHTNPDYALSKAAEHERIAKECEEKVNNPQQGHLDMTAALRAAQKITKDAQKSKADYDQLKVQAFVDALNVHAGSPSHH